MKVTKQDKELMEKAAELIKKRRLKGRIDTASALITNKGNIYLGVDIVCKSEPCSICAEYSSVVSMLTHGEQKIKTIVAVADDGAILPPCGKCRELIFDVSGGDSDIIVNKNEKFRLRDLEKYYWRG
ncbi:cytidine deaminase [Candidatus Woesearchaeota archaeon]|nr:cytidine deaminase [Candidatus Woesearchaeota archaeon]